MMLSRSCFKLFGQVRVKAVIGGGAAMPGCGNASGKSCRQAGGYSGPPAPSYRARRPLDSALNRIVLDNLSEFKLWMRDPPDHRPRPHPAAITAMEKFVECGDMRFGAVRYRCPDCGHDIFVALGYLAYCTSSGLTVIG